MPKDVIFIEPCFPHNQREFVRALHSVGARVTAIGERPKEYLDDEMRHWLTHYEQVSNVTSEEQVERAVRFVQSKVHVDALEAVVEAHVMTAAKVREKCGIKGTTVKTTWLCRDKPSMKEALRKAGIPCASRSVQATSKRSTTRRRRSGSVDREAAARRRLGYVARRQIAD